MGVFNFRDLICILHDPAYCLRRIRVKLIIDGFQSLQKRSTFILFTMFARFYRYSVRRRHTFSN